MALTEEAARGFKKLQSRVSLSAGPFSLFFRRVHGKNASCGSALVLQTYRLWMESPPEIKQECQRIYEAQFGAHPDTDFKPVLLKIRRYHRRDAPPPTPYHLWLEWYLREHADEQLLKRDSLEIAIELGVRWSSMSETEKQPWEDKYRQVAGGRQQTW